MARSYILLDSNAYFRLAKSIHPLLNQVFGKEQYCLFVISDIEKEFSRSQRLKSKFQWVNDEEYLSNRKALVTLSAKQRGEEKQAYEHISKWVVNNGLNASPVDMRALSTAFALRVPIVTDDQAMLQIAVDFGIRAMNTLELTKLMLDSGHIDMDHVRQIASYIQYTNDIPFGFYKDYKRLFDEDSPASF